MRFYLDTEFHEPTMTLISLGLVNQRGDKFYAVNADWVRRKETDWSLSSAWLEENVVPHLFPVAATIPPVEFVCGPLEMIADKVRVWCNLDQAFEGHEFWAYYADWDWVLFRRLFGSFDDMPMALPLLCLDLKQLALSAGIRDSLEDVVKPIEPRHCALADAVWCKFAHELFILQYQRSV